MNSDIIIDRLRTGDLIFALCSLSLSTLLFFLILLNTNLRSLTYDFLMFVFLSEMIHSIANIIEYAKVELASMLLIPLSDIFTFSLFCFFMYCSCEQLIKSNKEIKSKLKIFIPISAGIGIIYGIAMFFIIRTQKDPEINFYFYENSNLNYIRFIHVGILFLMSVYICFKDITLLKFLKEKQSSDSANSWKIAILMKTLLRFPIICVLYWLVYIVFIFFSKIEDLKFVFILRLFAKGFLGLRGFLFALNTIQTNKIQVLIQKIIEVYIRHNLILKLKFSSGKKKNKKEKESK